MIDVPFAKTIYGQGIRQQKKKSFILILVIIE
ncbi:hypothetical protein P378_14560 [Desulforamulus profundi]|uniref:Uncharacterized protein n=1 Tax=Desulforamulus profundi TaxID=1383067 RepID=A0A2C6M995_9FIRM|nr:hypothetical protein P378_14560 [Desulforamulus profundi]